MPKIVDYPHCSFDDALEVVKVISKVGGKAPIGVIADEMKLKETGGGFRSKIAGSLKFGMLSKDGKMIHLTGLGDKFMHPIDDKERSEALFESFLSVPIFKELFENFKGKNVEKQTLISLLIRVHNVNRNAASKVAGYFLKACLKYNFLNFNTEESSESPEDFEESLEVQKEGLEEEIQKKNSNLIEKSILDRKIFEIILYLGDLLYNPNISEEHIAKIEELIEEKKETLTHAGFLGELISTKNNLVYEKLKLALLKDLNIEEE